MKYRTLGRTNLSVSALGLGTVELGRDWGIAVPGETGMPLDEEAQALLRRAVALGVNFLDTARYYGKSEERLGRFLAGMGRDAAAVLVATKVPMNKKDGLAAMRRGMSSDLEASLKALGREPLDLVQLHSARLEDIQDTEAWEVLEKARLAGKLRFIGATFYDPPAARAAVESGAYDTVQPTYNLAMPQAGEVIELAGKARVGVIVKTPLGKGMLGPKRAHAAAELAGSRSAVDRLRFLERGDQTLPQAAVRYCLARAGVSTVIAGTRSIRHLEENADAVEGELFQEEIARIEELQRAGAFEGFEIP
ncbi:MAG TPA: aldo/keto reductase [Planctomycetota bacterium]|nr:aldo/keto reductase [Planctomycetota bacterium]